VGREVSMTALKGALELIQGWCPECDTKLRDAGKLSWCPKCKIHRKKNTGVIEFPYGSGNRYTLGDDGNPRKIVE